MKYQPNFNDPRVKSRMRHALGFSTATMSSKPHEWSSRYIDKYFGNSRHNLSKWLRKQLLITHSERYNKDTGQCKSYSLNPMGVRYLRDILAGGKLTSSEWANMDEMMKKFSLRELITETDMIEVTTPPLHPSVAQVGGSQKNNTDPVSWVLNEYKDELSDFNFTYNDKSHRLWHPLQNVRREVKKAVFAETGLNYQYDIECCAATLIHQYAQRCDMDLYLFALRKYINDKEQTRQEIATYTGMTIKEVKEVVNALFCGAKVGHNERYSLFVLLNMNIQKMSKLKEMPYITELRKDIKTCWTYIEPHTYRTTKINKTGREVKVAMSCRQKWNIYFDCERQVLSAVRDFMDMTGNKYFLEHDGWASLREILPQRDLIDYVRWKSGYAIQVKSEQVNK